MRKFFAPPLFPFLFYLAVSALYSFALIDGSFFNLRGDTLNIGSIVFPEIFPDIFTGGFVEFKSADYHLPLFLSAVVSLMKITGSYILTLRIILFIFLFCTLLSTHWLAGALFPSFDFWRRALVSLFMSFALVCLPSGEIIGFAGLDSAIPRYSFGVFAPLLLGFYWLRGFVRMGSLEIPSIMILGAACGLLINLHPPSACAFFAVMAAHWFFYRAPRLFPKGIPRLTRFAVSFSVLLISVLFFAVFSFTYVSSYLRDKYLPPERAAAPPGALVCLAGAAALPSAEDIKQIQDDAVRMVRAGFYPRLRAFPKEDLVFWLEQLFFPPFLLPLLFFLLAARHAAPGTDRDGLFGFLRGVFISGYCVNAAGSFLRLTVEFGPFFYVFQRVDRFLAFTVELLIVWFLARGRGGFKLRAGTFYWVSALILVYWLSLSRTRGRLGAGMGRLVDFCGLGDGREAALLLSGVFALLILLALLARKTKTFSAAAGALVPAFLTLLLVCWLALSSAPRIFAGHMLDSLAGLKAWSFVPGGLRGSGQERIKCFDDTVRWIRDGSGPSAKFMWFDYDKAQTFKLAVPRDGAGAVHELGLSRGGAELSRSLCSLLAAGKTEEALSILIKMDIRFALAAKYMPGAMALLESKHAKLLYENDYYAVVRLE
jgi:hypothetical protein